MVMLQHGAGSSGRKAVVDDTGAGKENCSAEHCALAMAEQQARILSQDMAAHPLQNPFDCLEQAAKCREKQFSPRAHLSKEVSCTAKRALSLAVVLQYPNMQLI
jgi:hypothetical protein